MSSGFISEAEIEERRRIRQEEWEKVRQPDQPLEAPEEEYDNRTLFERLEEQRKKKEFEYEETHKLKNMIRGLDDDEIEFLDMVDRTKMEQEKRLQNEEAKELQQFRSKVAALKEKSLTKKIEEDEVSSVISSITESPSSGIVPQNKVLASIVKKRTASEKLPTIPAKKPALDCLNTSNNSGKEYVDDTNGESETTESSKCTHTSKSSRHGAMQETMVYPSARQCVGILPGIGSYISDDSSDSEHTSGSGSDIEGSSVFDFHGHEVQKKNVKST